MNTQSSANLKYEEFEALAADVELSPAELLKQQAAAKLAAHRERRTRGTESHSRQTALLPQAQADPKAQKIAATVAARYAQAQTYREFLAAEAEAAVRQAEAAAEIAARNAAAIAEAQTALMAELDQWTSLTPNDIAAATDTALYMPEIQIAHALEMTSELVGRSAAKEPEVVAVSAPTAKKIADIFDLLEEPHEVAAPVPLPANLIEFPRQLVASRKARPRLAEGPLRDEADAAPEAAQLRIFEVDAQTISTQPVVEGVAPEWTSIRLDARTSVVAEENHVQPSFALPLQTAEISQRMTAGMMDLGLVTAATGAFMGGFLAMAHRMQTIPNWKLSALAGGVAFFAFYLLYQMLFFTWSEATPGMRYARIALCTFGDDNPTRAAMRRRVGAMLMAVCPLGLGLAWAWVDDDRLGWHDRITRTYQRSY